MGKARTFEPSLETVILKQFKPAELWFDEDQTREILKFFFINHHSRIKRAKMNDAIREFTQGLLILAIDKSYQLGYIQKVFETYFMQPPTGLRGSIAQMIKEMPGHWFEHATLNYRKEPNIYESVRVALTTHYAYRTRFIKLMDGIEVSRYGVGAVALSKPCKPVLIWKLL